jgi:hypothetical protein
MFTEFKKAPVVKFNLRLDYTWKCPHCGAEHEVKNFGPSPYNAVAEETMDEHCKDCGKFSTLNFYED